MAKLGRGSGRCIGGVLGPLALLSTTSCLGPPPRHPEGPASTLTLENKTSDEVCGFFLEPTKDARGFGKNRLPPHDTVPAGGKRQFPATETHWNVRVKDCLGRMIYQRMDLPLGREPIIVVTDADADALLIAGQKYAH